MNAPSKALAVLSASVLLLGFASCGAPSSTNTTTAGNNTTSERTMNKMITLSDKKTEITYFKAKADMKMNSVTLGYMPDPSKPLITDPADDGNQFVRVELTFTNTGEEPFSMSYTNISLNSSVGTELTPTFLVNDGNADDLLKGAELAPGETVTGAMYFEVPATDKVEDLAVNYSGYDEATKLYTVEL